jgi:hypothetical protein
MTIKVYKSDLFGSVISRLPPIKEGHPGKKFVGQSVEKAKKKLGLLSTGYLLLRRDTQERRL